MARDLAELKVKLAEARAENAGAFRLILSKETIMSDVLADLKETAHETAAEVHQLATVATQQTATIADLTQKLDAALAHVAAGGTLDPAEVAVINEELKGANQEILNVLAPPAAPAAPEQPPAEPAPVDAPQGPAA